MLGLGQEPVLLHIAHNASDNSSSEHDIEKPKTSSKQSLIIFYGQGHPGIKQEVLYSASSSGKLQLCLQRPQVCVGKDMLHLSLGVPGWLFLQSGIKDNPHQALLTAVSPYTSC